MKKVYLFGALLICAFTINAQHTPDVNRFATNNRITDMVGIFYGSDYLRPKWDEDTWTPFVVHTFQNGEKKWFFQGFSFNELRMDKKSFIHTSKTEPATQKEWKKLIDLMFVEGRRFDALDKTIEKYRRVIGDPPFRHKIIVSIPCPVKGQSNWGTINGRRMNFNRDEDRITAVKWFINEFLSTYNKHHYSNFDLEGFAWTEEDMEQTTGLVVIVSNYIHQLGYRHYWKPYLKAKGSSYWDEYNFDCCYLQAGGYCINAKYGFERVEQALAKAKRRGMGIVFEFDSHIFSDPDTFIPRINESIDYFEQNNIYDNVPMSYYAGGTIIHSIFKGKEKDYSFSPSHLLKMRLMLDRIASHVVARYSKAYGTYPPQQQAPSSGQSSHGTNNDDWRNPDYWHF